MFDNGFAKAALKEYGFPIVLLAAIVILKQVGLLDIESMSSGVSTGTFFSGVICTIVTILVYMQSFLKKLKNDLPARSDNNSQSYQEIKAKLGDILHNLDNQETKRDKMYNTINSMYEVIKGVPNKHLIFEILVVRTMYLMNNSLEYILEYLITKNASVDLDALLLLQKTIARNMERLKAEYMESVVKIARNLIDNDNIAKIEEILDISIAKINTILIDNNAKVEEILFQVNNEIKDLDDACKVKFREALNIRSGDKDYIL